MQCARIMIDCMYAVGPRPRPVWEGTYKLLFPSGWRVPGLNRPHLSVLHHAQLLLYLHVFATDA